MKRAFLLFFAVVFLGHFFYVTGEYTTVSPESSSWAVYEFDQPEEELRWVRYTVAGDHWLGLSYGLAGAFAIWCFARMVRFRREMLAANTAGLTLSGVLGIGLCFLTGCCGSPMLPLYLGLIGPKFLSLTKPLTFVFTALSVFVGYAWMVKRTAKEV